jgi:glutamyl-tRNA reductase
VVECSTLVGAKQGRALVVVDLALPRDVDPAARDLDGVELRDIEDLRSVVDEGAELRKAELPKVQAIVEEAVGEFSAWERSLALGPAIENLKGWAERVRVSEVGRLAGTDEERAAFDRATKALVSKLLHRPMVQMRELVRGKDGQVYLEAFQEIFDLDPE